MRKFFETKGMLWLVVLGAFVAAVSSLVAQFVLGKQPCNLCIMQRVLVVSVGVIALFPALLTLFWKRMGKVAKVIMNLVVSVPAIAGACVAMKQIYIQSLPPGEVPACGSPISFMLDTMPVADVIRTVLAGSGECAKVETLMWIPLPWWSLMFFSGILIFVWGSWLFVGRKQN